MSMSLSDAPLRLGVGASSVCEVCGGVLVVRRKRSKRFCSNKCRMAAARARAAEPDTLLAELRGLGVVGKVWPVYRWDKVPAVYALLVPRHHALEMFNEVRVGDEPVAAAEFASRLRRLEMHDYGDPIEARLIAEFRLGRKDRRVEA